MSKIDYDKLINEDIDNIIDIINHDKYVQTFLRLKHFIINDPKLLSLESSVAEYKFKAKKSSGEEKIKYLQLANKAYEQYINSPAMTNYDYYLNLMEKKIEIVSSIFPQKNED